MNAQRLPYDKELIQYVEDHFIQQEISYPVLDNIVHLASAFCDMPIAMISVVNTEKEIIIARIGIGISEIPLHHSFCWKTIQSAGQSLVVHDCAKDNRFAGNPIVVDNPLVAFYAGVPLTDSNLFVLGTLAVMDYHPREFSTKERGALMKLASNAVAFLELMKAKNVLEEKNRRFKIVTQASNSGMWDWNLATNTLHWDKNMFSLHGLPMGAPILNYNTWKEKLHPEDADSVEEEIKLALSGTKEFDIEYRIIWPDFSTHYIKAVATVARNEKGDPITMMGTNRDITLMKDVQADLEKSRREIESFAHSVSHDLRAPLRGIEGWSKALMEDYSHVLDETGLQYLGRVRSQCLLMENCVDDLLKLARITKAVMIVKTVDLSEVAQVVAEEFKAQQPDRKIEFRIEPGLKIFGDYAMLKTLFTNLFSNSVRFTGLQDLALIEFGFTKAHEKKRAFFVRDNGVGFNTQNSKKLFSPFQSMHRQSEYPSTGTGMGLSTAKRIVELHHGDIWAEAEVNKGACFYFTLNS